MRVDYLSHVSAMLKHLYSLRDEWFAYLDGLWGPHTVNRFASADNCQPLGAPHTGRFCSQYFHPDAEWTDAHSLPWAPAWGGENNWAFPPVHLVGSAVTHIRACAVSVTLIFPWAPWASWWPSLCERGGWARGIVGATPLGPPSRVLDVSARDLRLLGSGPMIAVRFGDYVALEETRRREALRGASAGGAIATAEAPRPVRPSHDRRSHAAARASGRPQR